MPGFILRSPSKDKIMEQKIEDQSTQVKTTSVRHETTGARPKNPKGLNQDILNNMHEEFTEEVLQRHYVNNDDLNCDSYKGSPTGSSTYNNRRTKNIRKQQSSDKHETETFGVDNPEQQFNTKYSKQVIVKEFQPYQEDQYQGQAQSAISSVTKTMQKHSSLDSQDLQQQSLQMQRQGSSGMRRMRSDRKKTEGSGGDSQDKYQQGTYETNEEHTYFINDDPINNGQV